MKKDPRVKLPEQYNLRSEEIPYEQKTQGMVPRHFFPYPMGATMSSSSSTDQFSGR